MTTIKHLHIILWEHYNKVLSILVENQAILAYYISTKTNQWRGFKGVIVSPFMTIFKYFCKYIYIYKFVHSSILCCSIICIYVYCSKKSLNTPFELTIKSIFWWIFASRIHSLIINYIFFNIPRPKFENRLTALGDSRPVGLLKITLKINNLSGG